MGVNQNYKHSELTDKIIGVFYEVYNDLGFGFFESVYRNSFRLALIERVLLFRKRSARQSFFAEIWSAISKLI